MALIERQSPSSTGRSAVRSSRIQRKLVEDAARPIMGWNVDYVPQWPYVKGLVPHNNIDNYGRMQDVWLER